MVQTKPHTGVAGRWLGMEVRRFREAAGLSLDTVSAVLNWSPSKLSRMERGQCPETTPEEVSALLAAMKVTGEDRVRTMVLARRSQHDGLWEPPDAKTSLQARMFQAFESKASRIINIQPYLIPGLLQTHEYCTALLRGLGVAEGLIMRRTARRLGRQEIFARRDCPDLVFVIGEAALRRPLPSRLLMAHQVRHVARQAEHPKVAVHVLPESVVVHPALSGPFAVLEFEDGEPVVHIEGRMTGRFPENPAEVEAYRRAGEKVQTLALDADESRDLLFSIIEDLERTH